MTGTSECVRHLKVAQLDGRLLTDWSGEPWTGALLSTLQEHFHRAEKQPENFPWKGKKPLFRLNSEKIVSVVIICLSLSFSLSISLSICLCVFSSLIFPLLSLSVSLSLSLCLSLSASPCPHLRCFSSPRAIFTQWNGQSEVLALHSPVELFVWFTISSPVPPNMGHLV